MYRHLWNMYAQVIKIWGIVLSVSMHYSQNYSEEGTNSVVLFSFPDLASIFHAVDWTEYRPQHRTLLPMAGHQEELPLVKVSWYVYTITIIRLSQNCCCLLSEKSFGSGSKTVRSGRVRNVHTELWTSSAFLRKKSSQFLQYFKSYRIVIVLPETSLKSCCSPVLSVNLKFSNFFWA